MGTAVSPVKRQSECIEAMRQLERELWARQKGLSPEPPASARKGGGDE